MVDLQLKGLASPDSNRNKAGNARPVYGGVFDGSELTALVKAGEYRSPARILADEPAYMNIHELVVADPEQYAEVIAQSLEFGRNILKIHPGQQASVEVFSIDAELEPYFANGFDIAAYDKQSYSFGSQTEATVHRLVRPNLRPQ